jgi:hypothetical protein
VSVSLAHFICEVAACRLVLALFAFVNKIISLPCLIAACFFCL